MSTGITDYSNGNYTHQTDIDKYLNNDDNDTSGNISSPGVSVSITMKVNDVSELEILEQVRDNEMDSSTRRFQYFPHEFFYQKMLGNRR